MTAINGTQDECQEQIGVILPIGTTASEGTGGTNKALATQIADQVPL